MSGDLPQWEFVCQTCASRFPLGPRITGCPVCLQHGRSGLLECERISGAVPRSLNHRGSARGLPRYLDLLPCSAPQSWISLGEGGTALIPSKVVGPALGLKSLWFKLEQQNPTLSFKDRFVSMTVNAARTYGYKRAAVSSTGNLGISAAAYCAAAGMECLVIVPDGTPESIVSEANLHGARVVALDRSIRFRALEVVAEFVDWFPIGLFLNRPVQNPFGVEGYRTFAYECIEALGDSPAAMLFPCARGNGLYGAWKGFQDALGWGWSARKTQMVGCQPSGANSLDVSLRQGSDIAVELPPFDSIAKSVSEAVASDKALGAIRESRGTALAASDDEIRQAFILLGREGLNVEVGSALPVACLPRLLAAGGFTSEDPIVCVLTATGLRWSEQAAWIPPNRSRVDSLEELKRVLR